MCLLSSDALVGKKFGLKTWQGEIEPVYREKSQESEEKYFKYLFLSPILSVSRFLSSILASSKGREVEGLQRRVLFISVGHHGILSLVGYS